MANPRMVGFYCPVCFKPWLCLETELKHPTVRRCPFMDDKRRTYCMDADALKRGYTTTQARMEGKRLPDDIAEIVQTARAMGGTEAGKRVVTSWLMSRMDWKDA